MLANGDLSELNIKVCVSCSLPKFGSPRAPPPPPRPRNGLFGLRALSLNTQGNRARTLTATWDCPEDCPDKSPSKSAGTSGKAKALNVKTLNGSLKFLGKLLGRHLQCSS